jgi:hypothetical protein
MRPQFKPILANSYRPTTTEYNIYCGFINTVGLYIRLSYFHPFQQFFIHIDIFYPFFIHYSSNLPTLNNVEKIVWPTVYVVLGVVVIGIKYWVELFNFSFHT